MGQWFFFYSKLNKQELVGVKNLILKSKEKVIKKRPEAEWSNHEQVEESCGNAVWRTEPVSVEKYWDDLWLGVKG